MDKRPIGVFDTGVGGLTVVKEVLKRLPNEQIIYIGDAARAPYGSKPFRVINEYALEITHFLVSKDGKVIVSACNTISSTRHKLLSKSSKTPVLDIIKPVIDEFAEIYAKVGIMATEATVKMGAHEKLLLKKNPNI